MTRAGFPPGPPLPRALQGIALVRRPLELFEYARRERGDIFSLALPGGPPRVVTGNPDHIQTIFALPPDGYRMADQSIPLNLGEASPLLLDGERHRAQHRLVMPPLHGPHLRAHAEAMAETTHALIDRWSEGEPFTLLEQMQWITLTVICRCVLGTRDEHRLARMREVTTSWLMGPGSGMVLPLSVAFGAARVRQFLDRQVAASPFAHANAGGKPRLLPWRRLADAKAELMAMLADDLRRCRAHGVGERVDVLALLAQARDDQGQLMPLAEALDVLVTMLVGGYETTANTLVWVVHHLLAHPGALARVREENRGLAGEPLHARRPWLDACIKESQRLRPVALFVDRKVVEPLRLGDYLIPGGTTLWPSTYLAQTHAALWRDPHRFRPERFLADRRPRANQWFPFGGGQRRCAGAAFAEVEMRIVAAILADRVELARAPGSDPRPVLSGITLSPRDRLRVVAREIRQRDDC